jgi:hypothetical protein
MDIQELTIKKEHQLSEMIQMRDWHYKEFQKFDKAIKSLMGEYTDADVSRQPLIAPVKYSPDFNLSKKMSYVIKQAGKPLMSKEIVNAIMRLEKGLDEKVLFDALMPAISRLNKAGKLLKFQISSRISKYGIYEDQAKYTPDNL